MSVGDEPSGCCGGGIFYSLVSFWWADGEGVGCERDFESVDRRKGVGSWREIVFWWFGREGRVAAGWDCYMGISKAMEDGARSCKGFCHRGMYFLD